MTLFYFNADNSTQFKVLETLGIKNISISYKFVKKNIGNVHKRFESIILNPGSGKRNFEASAYYDFVKNNRENYNMALQFDEPGEIRRTMSYYHMALERGLDWIIPILHEDYNIALNYLNPILRTNVIALGRGNSKLEEDEYLQKLPAKTYHGLAKSRWLENKSITSVDSSTWLSGVRNGKIQLMFQEGIHEVFLTELNEIQRSMELNREFVDFKPDDIKKRDHRSILKLSLCCHYIPMFKKLGIYDKNIK